LEFIQKGGGAFRDMGVHVLDAVWWLLGKPKPLYVLGAGGAKFGPHGAGYTQETPKDIYEQFAVDDYAGGFIAFAGNVGLQVESFWASHQPTELQIELFGTEAGAKLSPLTIYRMENGVEQNLTPEPIKKMEAFDRIANHFIASILDGEPCKAPLRDGLIVQQMMEAVLNSVETGQPVAL
jgi:predicted dehydrogenase